MNGMDAGSDEPRITDSPLVSFSQSNRCALLRGIAPLMARVRQNRGVGIAGRNVL